jgi:hypothetical protein
LVEDRLHRKYKEKHVFLWYFARFALSLHAEGVRSCSRSAIDALQRHTLHLQVREASWLSLNHSLAGGKKLKEKNYGNNHRKITDITSD